MPRSPKLNGHVERAHRTHAEEFYEVTPSDWALLPLNRQLQSWEHTYNTVRPHQALGYLTPQQFVTQWQSKRKEAECHSSCGRVQVVDWPSMRVYSGEASLLRVLRRPVS